MQPFKFVTLLFLFFHLTQTAQVYEATIGGDGYDVLNAVKHGNVNGMMAAGHGVYNGNSQVLFVTMNNLGQTLLAKNIGSDGAEFGQDIIQTNDLGYAICGWTTENGSDDIFILKLNETGTVQWVKVFEDSGIDRARAIVESGDGSLVVAGHSNSGGMGLNDIVVIKLSAEGNLEWKYKYGGNNNDNAWGLDLLPNGNYVVGGNSSSFNADNYTSAFLMEIDPNGDLIWFKTYTFPEAQLAATDCEVSTSGQIVFGGWIQGVDDSNRQGLIAKVASDGTFQSAEAFGEAGFESVNGIALVNDEVLAAGVTSSYFLNIPDTDNGFVTRFNENDEIVVFQGFESGVGGDDDELFGVDNYPAFNNGFVASGVFDADQIRQGHLILSFDFWDDCPILFTEISQFSISLTSVDGGSRDDDESTLSEPGWTATDIEQNAQIICSTGLNTLQEEAESWKLYPNPTHDYIQLENVKKGTSILIQDITGREILSENYKGSKINLSTWPNGIYLIQIAGQKTYRMLKQ